MWVKCFSGEKHKFLLEFNKNGFHNFNKRYQGKRRNISVPCVACRVREHLCISTTVTGSTVEENIEKWEWEITWSAVTLVSDMIHLSSTWFIMLRLWYLVFSPLNLCSNLRCSISVYRLFELNRIPYSIEWIELLQLLIPLSYASIW